MLIFNKIKHQLNLTGGTSGLGVL